MSDTSNVLHAFTAGQVARLTGLSDRQLAYWDRTGFFVPWHAAEDRRSSYSCLYSFKDVVGLRTLSILKGRHGVSLPHLRAVAERLCTYSQTPWADLKLKVWNRKVQFDEPETGRTRGVLDGQFVLFRLDSVIEEVKREAEELRKREPSQIGRIEKHRYVAHNAPVIAGTRIPVSTVRRYLEAGFNPAQIVQEYPTLTEADIEAVQRQDAQHSAA